MESLSPTELIAVVNQTLEYSYGDVVVVGEVASFKVNQGKWVFFDLKDAESSIGCFMPVWELRMPIEDGMRVMAKGAPKLTKWGKFSFTVTAVQPVGEGNLKKAYEMLKQKLAAEGLFDPAKKRKIPKGLASIGVISSTAAAGYADFVKIFNARWGGTKLQVAHTQVQGLDAPNQIIRALNYFNEHGEVQAIAIIRGGGSADDLACFNDEQLARTIAASKIPVITGIGHEVDESLADLAADVRASTPSNAAELLTDDKKMEKARMRGELAKIGQNLVRVVDGLREQNQAGVKKTAASMFSRYIDPILSGNKNKLRECWQKLNDLCQKDAILLKQKMKTLEALDPEKVLRRGYAILSGKISPGNVVKITTFKQEIKAIVKEANERS